MAREITLGDVIDNIKARVETLERAANAKAVLPAKTTYVFWVSARTRDKGKVANAFHVGACEASCDEEAFDFADTVVFKLYPVADGWADHSVEYETVSKLMIDDPSRVVPVECPF